MLKERFEVLLHPTTLFLVGLTTGLTYSGSSPFVSIDRLVGLLILPTLTFLVHSIRQSRSLQSLNIISVSCFILSSFYLPISNLLRAAIVTFILAIFSKITVTRPLSFKLFSIHLNLMMVINLIFVVLQSYKTEVLQFLGYGYDNAFHFAAYRGLTETNWFYYFSNGNWWTDFDLFKNYPTGSSALFSFVSISLPISNVDPYSLVIGYYTMFLMIVAFYLVLVFKIIRKCIKVSSHIWLYFGLSISISSPFLFTLLTNGFPPYALSVVILLIWYLVDDELELLSSRLFTFICTALVLLLVTPAPLFFLVIPGFLILIEFSKLYFYGTDKRFQLRIPIMLLVSILIFYMISRSSSSNFGWRQLLEPGGVNKPSIWLASTLSCAFLYVFWKMSPSIMLKDKFFILLLSGVLSVFGLSLLTYLNTGEVRYYAVKQYYLWAAIAPIFIIARFAGIFEKRLFIGPRSVVPIILVCVMVVQATLVRSPNVFMGDLPAVLRATLNKDTWEYQIIDARKLLSISLNKSKWSECILNKTNPYESDLNSRWANAISRGFNLSEDCFGIYWNSSNLDLDEISVRVKNSGIRTSVFITEPEQIEIPSIQENDLMSIKFIQS